VGGPTRSKPTAVTPRRFGALHAVVPEQTLCLNPWVQIDTLVVARCARLTLAWLVTASTRPRKRVPCALGRRGSTDGRVYWVRREGGQAPGREESVPRILFNSVDEYISSQPETLQRTLTRVRGAILKAVPHADEMISYGLPTYKLHGRPVIYFAGWKEHYSIYPSTDRLVAALKDQLAPYEVSKGTIRFPYSESVPTQLIHRIARFRLKEVTEPKTTATRKKQ
jgi:uncharacterized protein YdhG (YjbR/CyaY superfamily)